MNPSSPPQRIGKYDLEEYIGGGMSAVYRARDTLMNRPVAVKILKEAYRPDDPVAQRFLLEAQIAGNLNHENVIRTYDFGFDPEGRPYMVLEYLEGEDLLQAIKGGRAGDLRNRARLAWELAGALEYIHPRNVIHRDLKPANVFLSGGAQGTAKLMDFGISRTEAVSITQAGMTMGTPGYMAPEQIRGEQVTKAADIYSFGVLLWELFTSQRAFAGDSLDRVFYLALNEPLDMARLRAAGVPEELAALIGKCGAKDAWQRPPDLRAVRDELARLMNGAAGSASAARPDLEATLAMAPADAAPAASAPSAPASRPTPAAAPESKANLGLWIGGGIGAAVAVAAVLWLMSGSGGGGGGGDPARQATTAGTTAAANAGRLAEQVDTSTGPMMLVPEMVFQFGRDKQSVNLPAFYVDKTEVTNRAYAEFARATGAALPPGFNAAQPDLPAVNITFDEAEAFAQWAGKRLPTTKQWEKAARGLDGRTFPWGEAGEAVRANVGKGPKGALVAVTMFPDGAGPFQALQMVGNAWEWVDETAAPSGEMLAAFARQLTPPPAPGERWVEIRGGSVAEPLDAKVLWDRAVMPVRYRSPLIGFRCVKPAE